MMTFSPSKIHHSLHNPLCVMLSLLTGGSCLILKWLCGRPQFATRWNHTIEFNFKVRVETNTHRSGVCEWAVCQILKLIDLLVLPWERGYEICEQFRPLLIMVVLIVFSLSFLVVRNWHCFNEGIWKNGCPLLYLHIRFYGAVFQREKMKMAYMCLF